MPLTKAQINHLIILCDKEIRDFSYTEYVNQAPHDQIEKRKLAFTKTTKEKLEEMWRDAGPDAAQ